MSVCMCVEGIFMGVMYGGWACGIMAGMGENGRHTITISVELSTIFSNYPMALIHLGHG